MLHVQSRIIKAGNETNPKNSETNADFAKTVRQLRNYTTCTYAASFTELFWIEKMWSTQMQQDNQNGYTTLGSKAPAVQKVTNIQ